MKCLSEAIKCMEGKAKIYSDLDMLIVFYLSRLDSATGGNEITWARSLFSKSMTLSCFLAKSYNFTLSSNIPLASESSATNSIILWVLVPWNLKDKCKSIGVLQNRDNIHEYSGLRNRKDVLTDARRATESFIFTTSGGFKMRYCMTLYLKGHQKYDMSKLKNLNLLNKCWSFSFELFYSWYSLR